MNKLLIHSNNTSFNNTALFNLAEQFVFDIDLDKEVDIYINELLSDWSLMKKLEKCEIVFIKVSLSQNYLEYLGIRLAYHIRLTKNLGIKACIPIVFISQENLQQLGLTYPEPSILFTKGIYFIKETLEDYQKIVNWYNEGKLKPLTDFNSFASSLTTTPPANYHSHHSIANEWALYRYFTMFEEDKDDDQYIKLKNKIQNLDYLKTLHFKHLESKQRREKFNPKKDHSISPVIRGINERKIGVIDDEINKGWLEFYNYILKKSNATAFAFNDYKKNEKKPELIEKLKKWVDDMLNSDDPIDIFIVDLRLHDDDFNEHKFNKLSGIQIIEFINYNNPGVQIIVATASNKVWNFQECSKFGVKHFSIKESPETYNTRSETIASYKHLCNQISEAAALSFLASLYRNFREIKNRRILINTSSEQAKAQTEEFANLTFKKNGLLDQIFNLLVLDSSNEKILNQCLLIAFQVLENYCNLDKVGSFGYDKSSGKIFSSGFIWEKEEGRRKDIFINKPPDTLSSWFELVDGKFSFQKENSKDTPISFKVFEKMKLISVYKSGLDSSFLIKMICVLFFREKIPKNDIERLIELRYYRSNVAAHMTGNVKTDFHIKVEDICFFVKIFNHILK